jgi:hypothetical protein
MMCKDSHSKCEEGCKVCKDDCIVRLTKCIIVGGNKIIIAQGDKKP